MAVVQRLDPGTAQALAETGRWLAARGWAPATSGNFSVRTPDGIAITSSGRDKTTLAASHILLVDDAGAAIGDPLPDHRRPSAETLLHCHLYRRRPEAGAVLHTHSVAATVLSRRIGAGGTLVLDGYELAKAFAGITDHQTALRLPVLANRQDMAALAADADAALDADPHMRAYLIAGHGTYTWAADLTAARHQIEALEFLYACALHG